jgi:hypothetical protein
MITHIPSRVIPSNSIPIPPHVNQVLQQLGLPQLPNHNPAPNPAPNLNPFRPLIIPMLLHVLRIVLVLYFFAPARKPLFGILIGWLIFELWQRVLFNNRAIDQQRPDAVQQNRQEAPVPHPPADVALAPDQTQRPQQHVNTAIETLANYNLQREEQMLAGAGVQRPTVRQKIYTFFSLLATTVHPAVWDRRRMMLRRREGRIRTDEAARRAEDSDPVDEARAQRRAELNVVHRNRAPWVRDYIQRAVNGDWVEEAD